MMKEEQGLSRCSSCGRGVSNDVQECTDCIEEWMMRNGFEE